MLRALIAVAVLALLAPAAATARGPYAVESSVAGTLADGDRYAAWARKDVVRVLDEQSRTTTSHPLPAGCGAPGAIGAGRLASGCGNALQVLDIATGVWTPVPATEALTGLLSVSAGIQAIGSVWIELFVELDHRGPAFPAWVEHATGRVVSEDPGDVRQYANLDAPALWTPLCDPLRRRKNPDYDDFTRYGSPFIAPRVAGNRALEYTRADVLVLRRCGSTRRTVLTRSWHLAGLGGTRVSWIDGLDDRTLAGDPRGRGRVYTYDALTRRRRSWRMPGGVNPNVDVVHTRRHIFIDKHSSGRTVRRYAVDL